MNITSLQLINKLQSDLDPFYLAVEDESDQHAGHAVGQLDQAGLLRRFQ